MFFVCVCTSACVCINFLSVCLSRVCERVCVVHSCTRSLVFSLVYKVRVRATMATSPLIYLFIYFFVSLSLSSRQQQPHGPQDILDPSLHHTSSTPTLPKVPPTLFYTVTYSRFTGSALATPPLTPPWKVLGMHDEGAHTLCLPVDCIACLTLAGPLLCILYMQVWRQPARGLQTQFYAGSLQGQTNGSVAKAQPANVIIWL